MEFDLYTLLDILSKAAIIAGGIFAAIQLVQIRKQRSRESALQMLNSLQTPEFIEGMNIIYTLPRHLPKKEIEAYLGDDLSKVMIMFMKLESVSILVHKKEIKLVSSQVKIDGYSLLSLILAFFVLNCQSILAFLLFLCFSHAFV